MCNQTFLISTIQLPLNSPRILTPPPVLSRLHFQLPSMEEADHHFSVFHAPQQSRRDKLRINSPYNNYHDHLLLPPSPSSPYFALSYPTTSTAPQPSSSKINCFTDRSPSAQYGSVDLMGANGGLNLSLATNNRGPGGVIGSSIPNSARWKPVVVEEPVGPFTGYASILSRSRFLMPAQEMLEEFAVVHRGRVAGSSGNVAALEADSAAWKDDSVSEGLVSGCGKDGLMSMLHEVYRRYRLYCQQMHSAVKSFEIVAGLGKATPFLCFAFQSTLKHFHCLKNAILDYIQVTSRSFNNDETKKGGATTSCLQDPVLHDNKPVQNSSCLESPVWRSQRGFPDKAVAVLRTWLFENFLHPYPSNSDKHMLAQRTGLTRNQVSNWFTNARVRLWKPMVEDIHTLEKQADVSKKVTNLGFVNMLPNPNSGTPQSLKGESQVQSIHKLQDDPQLRYSTLTINHQAIEQNKDQLVMSCTNKSDDQLMYTGGSLPGRHKTNCSALSSNQGSSVGTLRWTPHGQGIPFCLEK